MGSTCSCASTAPTTMQFEGAVIQGTHPTGPPPDGWYGPSIPGRLGRTASARFTMAGLIHQAKARLAEGDWSLSTHWRGERVAVRIRVERDDLADVLGRAGRAVGTRSPQPILHGLLHQARGIVCRPQSCVSVFSLRGPPFCQRSSTAVRRMRRGLATRSDPGGGAAGTARPRVLVAQDGPSPPAVLDRAGVDALAFASTSSA